MTTLKMRTVSSDVGTFGHLTLPDGDIVCTVERPWKDNEANVSCIPAGTYTLKKRVSGVVERTTHGQYKEGWEVTNVPNRTYIMLHVANWPRDVEGCIGVGETITKIEGEKAVSNSFATFKKVMTALKGQDEWTLEITRHDAEKD